MFSDVLKQNDSIGEKLVWYSNRFVYEYWRFIDSKRQANKKKSI